VGSNWHVGVIRHTSAVLSITADLSLRQPSHRIRSRAFVPTTTTGSRQGVYCPPARPLWQVPELRQDECLAASSPGADRMVPLAPGHRPAPWPRLEDLDAARRPDRRGGVQGRSAGGWSNSRSRPPANSIRCSPPAEWTRTSRCSATRRARAAATQSLESTSGLALGGLVATEKA
jgi:hypothetical protein